MSGLDIYIDEYIKKEGIVIFYCQVFLFLLSHVLCLFLLKSILEYFEDDLDSKIDNLHSTDDGEPSEESHGSSNS